MDDDLVLPPNAPTLHPDFVQHLGMLDRREESLPAVLPLVTILKLGLQHSVDAAADTVAYEAAYGAGFYEPPPPRTNPPKATKPKKPSAKASAAAAGGWVKAGLSLAHHLIPSDGLHVAEGGPPLGYISPFAKVLQRLITNPLTPHIVREHHLKEFYVDHQSVIGSHLFPILLAVELEGVKTAVLLGGLGMPATASFEVGLDSEGTMLVAEVVTCVKDVERVRKAMEDKGNTLLVEYDLEAAKVLGGRVEELRVHIAGGGDPLDTRYSMTLLELIGDTRLACIAYRDEQRGKRGGEGWTLNVQGCFGATQFSVGGCLRGEVSTAVESIIEERKKLWMKLEAAQVRALLSEAEGELGSAKAGGLPVTAARMADYFELKGKEEIRVLRERPLDGAGQRVMAPRSVRGYFGGCAKTVNCQAGEEYDVVTALNKELKGLWDGWQVTQNRALLSEVEGELGSAKAGGLPVAAARMAAYFELKGKEEIRVLRERPLDGAGQRVMAPRGAGKNVSVSFRGCKHSVQCQMGEEYDVVTALRKELKGLWDGWQVTQNRALLSEVEGELGSAEAGGLPVTAARMATYFELKGKEEIRVLRERKPLDGAGQRDMESKGVPQTVYGYFGGCHKTVICQVGEEFDVVTTLQKRLRALWDGWLDAKKRAAAALV